MLDALINSDAATLRAELVELARHAGVDASSLRLSVFASPHVDSVSLSLSAVIDGSRTMVTESFDGRAETAVLRLTARMRDAVAAAPMPWHDPEVDEPRDAR